MDQSGQPGQASRRGVTDARICSCERRVHACCDEFEPFHLEIPVCKAVSRGLALPLPRGMGELKDQLAAVRLTRARLYGSSRRALV